MTRFWRVYADVATVLAVVCAIEAAADREPAFFALAAVCAGMAGVGNYRAAALNRTREGQG